MSGTLGVPGGLALADLTTLAVVRSIQFALNPDLLVRELAPLPLTSASETTGPNGNPGNVLAGGAGAGAATPGPHASERLSFSVPFDATNELERPDANTVVAAHGLHPRLAALETICFPDASLARRPLVLFRFGADRTLPVEVESLVIREEAFDAQLHPVRATADVVLRVIPWGALDPVARTLVLLQPVRGAFAADGGDGGRLLGSQLQKIGV